MKKKQLAFLFFGLLLLNTACEEVNREEIYNENFHKILYLKTTGVVDMTLYKTGENADYKLSVIKGGSEPELTANVQLGSMTKAELDEYCAPRGLNLVGLPESCYELVQTNVEFGSEDLYKMIGLSMHTSDISDILVSEPETQFVIPLILKSATDSINANSNLIIIRPNVVIPQIAFDKEGYVTNYCAKEGKTFEIPLTLEIDNRWDFDCEVEVDPSALDGTPYNLLPASSYTIANNGLVSFKKGSSTTLLKVTINGLVDADNVLPLRLKSTNSETFRISKNPVLFGVTINKYPLTENMLSSNALEPTEGSLQNLLDGDITTYFHSQWSGTAIADKHYVQVALPENLSSFKFSYTNRSANGNVALADFDVSVSTDGTNFVLLKNYTTAADKLPTGAAGVFNSYLLKSSTPFSYIRFTCNKSMTDTKYFVWSEFSMYGL